MHTIKANNLIRTIRRKALERHQSQYSQEHESCPLCGARLVLHHAKIAVAASGKVLDYGGIHEIAECAHCHVKARSAEFPLH